MRVGDKPNTAGLNFREFRGIMTPSSVMGSIGRVPGGPLSSHEKKRRNITSYQGPRAQPIEVYGNDIFPGTTQNST